MFTTAFEHGKHVVSANKAYWAVTSNACREGARAACRLSARPLGGGIPIVSTLSTTCGNKILTIAGILNGTTNYILSRMDAEGADYADVLADAQAKGYAEADPSADVDGFDAASKTAILASIGFGTRVTTDDVYQQGIRTIGAEDIAQARELGYTIKLLGIARNTDAGVDVRVHPTL
ncbi:MAG: homoserine dehydrogenase, partial [Collinsella sp.]